MTLDTAPHLGSARDWGGEGGKEVLKASALKARISCVCPGKRVLEERALERRVLGAHSGFKCLVVVCVYV